MRFVDAHCIYEGEFSAGKPNGYGRRIYYNGESYVCLWLDGSRLFSNRKIPSLSVAKSKIAALYQKPFKTPKQKRGISIGTKENIFGSEYKSSSTKVVMFSDGKEFDSGPIEVVNI